MQDHPIPKPTDSDGHQAGTAAASANGTSEDAALEPIRRLTRIGKALSAERDIERLLELIVDEARKFAGADGGTLYIMSEDERELHFAIVQTETLGLRMGGRGGRIAWDPIPLYHSDGKPNHGNVSAHVALTGKTVNISDVYDAQGFDFQGTRDFDARTGYRSRSMLVVPLKNHDEDTIGVLQLLNPRSVPGNAVTDFSSACQEMSESLASQAAVALSNNRLIHELESLMDAFIRTIATAIDEKSPYTGGHIRRVAELTMALAHRINESSEGPYAQVRFSEDELKELQIAAWLHDIGKITTPEQVMDKATKLEARIDRIEILRLRFALCTLQGCLTEADDRAVQATGESQLDKILQLISEINRGEKTMSETLEKQIRDMARHQLVVAGRKIPILSTEEIEALCIRQGTLTEAEREIIKNHARVTAKMLSQLPFPKKMRQVPRYAADHHETLAGKGYPRGLKEEQISLQSRIIALADIFEALTAKDRPYTKIKTLSEVLTLMEGMAGSRQIDPDLFALFRDEGLYRDYASRELIDQQIDVPL